MPAYRNLARHQNQVSSQIGPAMRLLDQEIDLVCWQHSGIEYKTGFEISENIDFQNLEKSPKLVW